MAAQGEKVPTSSMAWLNDQTLKASTQNNSNQNLVAALVPSAVGEYIIGKRDMYRAQSGVDHKMGRAPLVNVDPQQRHDTLSPFDDIPITTGKKNRPKTGARHHYINQGEKNES